MDINLLFPMFDENYIGIYIVDRTNTRADGKHKFYRYLFFEEFNFQHFDTFTNDILNKTIGMQYYISKLISIINKDTYGTDELLDLEQFRINPIKEYIINLTTSQNIQIEFPIKPQISCYNNEKKRYCNILNLDDIYFIQYDLLKLKIETDNYLNYDRINAVNHQIGSKLTDNNAILNDYMDLEIFKFNEFISLK